MPTQRLELTWIGKEQRHRLEPRILLEEPARSYHAQHRVADSDLFDNRLIFGDNLLALKALESEFTGKIKCVVIDPPYNTGSAFTHYDDGIEHSLWLSLMRDRLELIHRLLAPDGSLWITIDDNEAHYLKVLCDEIFGRKNFVANVVWEKSDSPRMDAQLFSTRHDHLLVFAKNIDVFQINKFHPTEDNLPEHYDRADENGRAYYLKPLRAMGKADTKKDRPSMFFPITAPDGTLTYPMKEENIEGRWRWGEEKIQKEIDRIEWVYGRQGWTPYYRIYGDARASRPPETIWPHEEVGSNRTSKNEIKGLFVDERAFDTPKPEALIERILFLATNPGDLVLDSFAGSGTTGAVAHKMGRRWIMVELGEHCHTHIIPRLQKVIDNQDSGGVTKTVGWGGGGGFRYYRLAPSLLERDKWGNWVVSKQYNAAMLAEAMCRHEGFAYAPSETEYWAQGRSSERDAIYTTTQTLTAAQLAALSEEVGPGRTLLVCCGAWHGAADDFPNLTLKKIPNAVLDRCEFGRDDYSLQIAALPPQSPVPAIPPDAPPARPGKPRKAKQNPSDEPMLFGKGERMKDEV
ncbi:MAG: site-specific DNA-methyltransferase [Armatimonadetes bacterium]|nr:site-specific DNA-methyltransferase [Armatimonadota bacterium]